MNILLVDDEKEYCTDLEEFLQKFDYEITSSNSGKEALHLLLKKNSTC
jgi:CheY-like chemotaxis protein